MTQISTITQLQALQDTTMIYAVIVFLVAVFIAFIISLMIPYEGGIDKSYKKRRVAYIIVGIVACLAFFLYNDLYVKDFIVNVGHRAMFESTNFYCLGITVGGYIITGLVMMLAFRQTKFGSILGKCKN